MEIAKYLCEFFFGDFWHWLGLLFMLIVIFAGPKIVIDKSKNIKKDD